MEKLSNRLVVYLVGGACVFVILLGIRASASILNPILLATVITITILPVPSRLKKRGLPGWLSLVLSIGVIVLILGLVILTVFLSVTSLATELPTYMDSGTTETSQDTSTDSSSDGTPQTVNVSVSSSPILQDFVGSIFNLLVQFGFALVIFFFMLSAAISMPGPSRLGFDPDSPIVERISALTGDVQRYMSILTGVNFLVGLGDTVFLLILGVDYALLWGLLAWFMGYIPSIGFIIALIPPMLMAYAQYGLDTALIVLVGYILINGGVQNFIQPKIMGQGLRISPVVVFISLLTWGFLLGGIGAILAVPLTLLVLIIMENFDGTRSIAVLMRYTGEAKKAERQEAAKHVRGLWDKVRGPFGSSSQGSNEQAD